MFLLNKKDKHKKKNKNYAYVLNIDHYQTMKEKIFKT